VSARAALATHFVQSKGQKRHTLLGIDSETKRGFCALCGLVAIVHKMQSRTAEGLPKKTWRCDVGVKPAISGGSRLYRPPKKELCERCGFVSEHSCQLDRQHIDGNRQNNSPDNVRTLCANCQRLARRKAAGRALPLPIIGFLPENQLLVARHNPNANERCSLLRQGFYFSHPDISKRPVFSNQGIRAEAEHTFFLKNAARSEPPPPRQ